MLVVYVSGADPGAMTPVAYSRPAHQLVQADPGLSVTCWERMDPEPPHEEEQAQGETSGHIHCARRLIELLVCNLVASALQLTAARIVRGKCNISTNITIVTQNLAGPLAVIMTKGWSWHC